MGWKQWSAVAVLIGGGILLQIPDHGADNQEGARERAGMPAHMAAAEAPYTTVALDVTGMT